MPWVFQEFIFGDLRFMSADEVYKLVPKADLLDPFLNSLREKDYIVHTSRVFPFQRCPERIVIGVEIGSYKALYLKVLFENFLATSGLPYTFGNFYGDEKSLPEFNDTVTL